MDSNLNQYWATLTEDSELLDHLHKKIDLYFDDLQAIGLLRIYERAFRSYYGGRVSTEGLNGSLFDNSRLSRGGKQGEKTRLKANHSRNLLRHLHQLTTAQKPEAQARASNSDYASQAQTLLANGLIDYYWREKNMGHIIKDAAELCLAIYGESFIHCPWNIDGGNTVMAPSGQPIQEGEQEFQALSPLDVIRDPSRSSSDQSDWVIVRIKRNRWDVIAENESFREDILNAPKVEVDLNKHPEFSLRAGSIPENEDLVFENYFYHKKTKTMPNGRMVKFVKGAKLFDGPLPYKNIPVRRLCADQLYGTIYGFTVAWDLLSLQDGIDTLHTTLMSNNKTFGIQSLWIKDTDKIQTSTLGQGMQLFKSEEKPEAVQLTQSAPETYNYLSILEHSQELISGISSTVRGNPEANLKSGNALALVVSQSIQFASSIEEAINRIVEDLATDLINNLKDFSQTPRVANIVGKAKRSLTKSFNAPEDLSEISKVVVEQINPLSRTIAGRAEMANNFLQQGLIKNTQDYMQVLSTGQLDSSMEGDQLELLAIQAENEDLKEGRPVQAVLIENHPLHIQHHKSVIADPESKKNPQLVQNTLDHIQQHLDLWRSMPPDLMAVLGIQAPPMPMGPVPAPSTPPQQGNAVAQEAAAVGQPNMPELPAGTPAETQIAYEKSLG